VRHGDAAQIAPGNISFVARGFEQRIQHFQMLARGDFRDDAAEKRVRVVLRGNQVDNDFHAVRLLIAIQNGDAGFVARSFNSKY